MEPTAERQWFGVKCLFGHRGLEAEPGRRVYEERIIVVLASGFDEAIVRAEAEAVKYIGGLGEYLGFCDAYCTGSATLGDGAEVYSLMREVTLDRREFINRYHEDGTETSRKT
jgi:hypothetical protein